MRLVLISDSHGLIRDKKLPDGDVLLHAGDLSMSGRQEEIIEELDWLSHLFVYDAIFIVPGNHERYINPLDRYQWFRDECKKRAMWGLIDDTVRFGGYNFYGSPWSPRFGKGWAFNADRGHSIHEIWKKIPNETDVLITHGPPAGYGGRNYYNEDCGCVDLREEVIQRVKPKLHVFGHIHEGAGTHHHPILPIQFVNASQVDVAYNPIKNESVFDLF